MKKRKDAFAPEMTAGTPFVDLLLGRESAEKEIV